MYHWSLSKIVLVFSYTCTLLASLMVPQKERPLKDIQELGEAVASGRYQFGTFNNTSLMANLLVNIVLLFKSFIVVRDNGL